MNIHKNARLTPKGREILVRRIVNGGLRIEEAAQASGVSVRTAYKWLARYRAQGRTQPGAARARRLALLIRLCIFTSLCVISSGSYPECPDN